MRCPFGRALAAALLAGTAACGDPGGIDPLEVAPEAACDPSAPATRTASCVLDLELGEGAGFGMEAYPAIVFGPPHGAGARRGSTDVLSLGKGGRIALGFGGGAIVDGPGADFIVFENPFYYVPTKEHPEGDPARPFKELGEVAVSEDGATWHSFPCARDAYPFEGCAGWHAVFSSPEDGVSAYDPSVAGGDAFDLADIGVEHARFVRVTDLSRLGAGGSAGFDLDAVAVVHQPAP